MEHHLNIATAAKLVGIGRRQIQQEIKQGNLDVFEGDVTVASLGYRIMRFSRFSPTRFLPSG